MVIALTLFRLPFYWKKGAPMWMAALVLTSAALGGMVGGAVYYATDPMRLEGRGRKVLANVLTLLAYLLAIGGVLFGTMAWLDRGA